MEERRGLAGFSVSLGTRLLPGRPILTFAGMAWPFFKGQLKYHLTQEVLPDQSAHPFLPPKGTDTLPIKGGFFPFVCSLLPKL